MESSTTTTTSSPAAASAIAVAYPLSPASPASAVSIPSGGTVLSFIQNINQVAQNAGLNPSQLSVNISLGNGEMNVVPHDCPKEPVQQKPLGCCSRFKARILGSADYMMLVGSFAGAMALIRSTCSAKSPEIVKILCQSYDTSTATIADLFSSYFPNFDHYDMVAKQIITTNVVSLGIIVTLGLAKNLLCCSSRKYFAAQ